MRISTRFLNGPVAILATLTLAACGGGTETTTTDEDMAVTDFDPGEGDGTINDTTLIDGTIGAEEAIGMESRMPADSSSAAKAPATASERTGADDAEAPASPPPAEEPAVIDNGSGEEEAAE